MCLSNSIRPSILYVTDYYDKEAPMAWGWPRALIVSINHVPSDLANTKKCGSVGARWSILVDMRPETEIVIHQIRHHLEAIAHLARQLEEEFTLATKHDLTAMEARIISALSTATGTLSESDRAALQKIQDESKALADAAAVVDQPHPPTPT